MVPRVAGLLHQLSCSLVDDESSSASHSFGAPAARVVTVLCRVNPFTAHHFADLGAVDALTVVLQWSHAAFVKGRDGWCLEIFAATLQALGALCMRPDFAASTLRLTCSRVHPVTPRPLVTHIDASVVQL